MGVGLALLVQETVLVHTFVSFRVPRSQINRADFPGAGIAGLLANAGVALREGYKVEKKKLFGNFQTWG